MRQTLSREPEKKQGVRLRAHGRAIGDLLRPDDTQATENYAGVRIGVHSRQALQLIAAVSFFLAHCRYPETGKLPSSVVI